jgi:arginine exporter protein ArgO
MRSAPDVYEQPLSLGATLATCLALTWLNPHVYLDKVVLVGSVSTQFAANKGSFRAPSDDSPFHLLLLLDFGMAMCTISVALVAWSQGRKTMIAWLPRNAVIT